MSHPCHGAPSVSAYVRARAAFLEPGESCLIDPFELPCPWGGKRADAPRQAVSFIARALKEHPSFRGMFSVGLSVERWVKIERKQPKSEE